MKRPPLKVVLNENSTSQCGFKWKKPPLRVVLNEKATSHSGLKWKDRRSLCFKMNKNTSQYVFWMQSGLPQEKKHQNGTICVLLVRVFKPLKNKWLSLYPNTIIVKCGQHYFSISKLQWCSRWISPHILLRMWLLIHALSLSMFSYFSGVHCPVRYNVSHCDDGSCISADIDCGRYKSWWRHQMETFSALLTLCEGNPPVTGGFPSQRPVTRSFDVFFDPRLNKRLSKQLIETPVIWDVIALIMTLL